MLRLGWFWTLNFFKLIIYTGRTFFLHSGVWNRSFSYFLDKDDFGAILRKLCTYVLGNIILCNITVLGLLVLVTICSYWLPQHLVLILDKALADRLCFVIFSSTTQLNLIWSYDKY